MFGVVPLTVAVGCPSRRSKPYLYTIQRVGGFKVDLGRLEVGVCVWCMCMYNGVYIRCIYMVMKVYKRGINNMMMGSH